MNKVLLNALLVSTIALLAACQNDSEDLNLTYIPDNHADIAYAAYSDSKTAALILQESVNTFID
jgi:uncharacterized iron-regulated protein